MFGFKFIKSQPTTYLMAFRDGKVLKEGAGLSLWYFAPTTTLVSVPVGSINEPFIFEKTTADFQAVSIQGQVSYRIADPAKTASLLNFSLRRDGTSYDSKDPEKLSERIIGTVQILVQQMIQAVPLTDAVRGHARIAEGAALGLRRNPEIAALGVEILGIAILAVKPTPETSRALEAKAREAILREADDAIYARRNAAVENERSIKQSELDTEIAVEQKKRAIRETQMEAEAAVRRKKNELRQSDMEADVLLEERRKSFVQINAENIRTTAEAEAHRVAAVVDALRTADPRIVQALAASGMQPGQLIAQAFTGLAEKAERIGQLNLSPELLQSLLADKVAQGVTNAKS